MGVIIAQARLQYEMSCLLRVNPDPCYANPEIMTLSGSHTDAKHDCCRDKPANKLLFGKSAAMNSMMIMMGMFLPD